MDVSASTSAPAAVPDRRLVRKPLESIFCSFEAVGTKGGKVVGKSAAFRSLLEIAPRFAEGRRFAHSGKGRANEKRNCDESISWNVISCSKSKTAACTQSVQLISNTVVSVCFCGTVQRLRNRRLGQLLAEFELLRCKEIRHISKKLVLSYIKVRI